MANKGFIRRNCGGEFSHKNPTRRKEAIRRVKKDYEKTKRGKIVRYFNYVAKSNFIVNAKTQIGCQNCGITDYRVLEFHHVNSREKSFPISTACACRSWKSLLHEISKCNVLCKNCHAIEHDGYWRGVIGRVEIKKKFSEIKEKQMQIDFKRKENIENVNQLISDFNNAE